MFPVCLSRTSERTWSNGGGWFSNLTVEAVQKKNGEQEGGTEEEEEGRVG